MFFLKRKNKEKNYEIYPDEIFLDSQNLPKFDTQQFEGKIEKPIKKEVFITLFLFLFSIIFIYFARIFWLQVIKGNVFADRAQKNNLKKELVFAPRATIVDRNGLRLAWTEEGQRKYIKMPGFSHILGYIGLPSKSDLDKNPNLPMNIFIGKEGVEKRYEKELWGKEGLKLVEYDSQNNIISESIQTKPIPAKDFVLSIDGKLQEKLFISLEMAAKNLGYKGGAGVIMDTNNGEILALTSYPEYDKENVFSYLNAANTPMLNRAISGLYAPGSIVKPFIALAALNENIISPEKKIYSSGSISVPNPYDPNKKNIFYDWRAHGWTNMKEAIAVSSDIYFYTIGGGYQNQRGLGISKIEEYSKIFGLDSKTGIDLFGETSGLVPDIKLKEKIDPKDPIWRIGDTYNASIGQGYFQVTPIEMAVAVGAIANEGKVLRPHVAKREPEEDNFIVKTIDIPKEYFQIIKEGMRMVVTQGTATTLNVYGLEVAAKTGTAQVGINKQYINSWVIGFFPYKNPKYAFAVVTEKGDKNASAGSQYVMRLVLDWIMANRPEYIK